MGPLSMVAAGAAGYGALRMGVGALRSAFPSSEEGTQPSDAEGAGDNPGGPYKIAEKNPLIMAYLLRGIDASPESFNLPPCIWIYL